MSPRKCSSGLPIAWRIGRYLTTYMLALGDPVPRRIDAALVGDPASHACTIEAVQRVADGILAFRRHGRWGRA
jgi:hypothetical protein